MKLLCKTSNLLQALQLVNRAISGQQALPILENVLIEVEGKRCRISATNLELSIVTSFEANIENEGSITVPAKAFLNFAQYNPDEEVLLETSEGTQLRCTSSQAKTVIAGESAQEYPTISPITKETSFALEAKPLLEALDYVTFASAKTTLRPVLSGVYVRAEKDQLIFVATDSYRLSEVRLPIKISQQDLSCIIPTKVLEELRTIIGAQKGDDKKGEEEKIENTIEISMSSQQIEFRVGGTTLLSRLIDGKFPNYEQIIPKDVKTTAVLPVKDFVTTTKRMHYFAREANNNLTCTLTKEHIHVATPQTQAGQDETTLAAGVSGDDNKIALSSSYLLDFLAHVHEPEIQMQLTDSMHPAIFTIPGNDQFLHLIMPLRIQGE